MLSEYSSLYLVCGNYNGAPQEVLSKKYIFPVKTYFVKNKL